MVTLSEWFQFWFVEYLGEAIEVWASMDAYDILVFIAYFIRGFGTPI